ncbi:MAG: NAD(P)H dehydrogenase (quinone) [Rhizobiaceae bacterium MnEN-MB40S]|nr:MAG: NAD(P)H dehydrogenase (quinone) [Rhizobiaceae bacterium MnEN-MB40S]
MRTLVLFAHPVPESFSSSLHTTVVETLSARGWAIDDCDLNAEGFSPVLTTEERRNYHEEDINTGPVAEYVERLQAAEALVLVFPVWNFGYPAILKGFFDRVFLPGISFKLVDEKVVPNLTNIRKLAAVTTYGGSRMRAFLSGDPPRKVVTRPLRFVMHPQVKTRYLALYDMNRADEEKRAGFVERVKTEMERF